MKPYFLSLLLLSILGSSAQDKFSDKDLAASYDEYTEMTRELAYIHLNKSTYIKGENIGFNAYVLNKSSMSFSVETTNLYCVISDKDKKLVKSKLIMINNGVGRGDFIVDDSFTSGEYTIKAYTNWMKNFDEQDYFVQTIKIIDSEMRDTIRPKNVTATIDAQFLPEGGHLIFEAKNTLGVIFKDSLGFGIPFIEGDLLDAQNNVVSSFKANQFGIGKFSFTPKSIDSYRVTIKFNGQDIVYPISDIKPKGIIMSLQDLKNKVVIAFKTNKASLADLGSQYFKLVIHNGNIMKTIDIGFSDKTEILIAIPYQDLSSGMNIFTLFDSKNNPILERLFFKYDGLSFAQLDEPIVRREKDSVIVILPFKNIDPNLFNNLSVSVLPAETVSYKHHNSIISKTLLQPYLKGAVEDAHYYFSKITAKKKYELDDLLITQGWSSYDWNCIFNDPPDYDFSFEHGIGFTVNMNNDIGKEVIIYPNANNPTQIISLTKEENSFERNGLFPLADEKIRIGEIKPNGKVIKPNLYIQFNPTTIPSLNADTNTLLGIKERTVLEAGETSTFNDLGWKRIERLKEVVLIKKQEYTRLEKLQNTSMGKIEIFDERKRNKYRYFKQYITTQGFAVQVDERSVPTFKIVNRNPLSPYNDIPVIYLDGVFLADLSILLRFRLDDVDYIKVNKSSVDGGLRTGGGIIKIVTKPGIGLKLKNKEVYREYDIPLRFSTPKRFYTPKYATFNSRFFKEYGVIDWFPNLSVDKNGYLNLKIFDTKITDIKLFIEGLANDKTFISQVQQITVK